MTDSKIRLDLIPGTLCDERMWSRVTPLLDDFDLHHMPLHQARTRAQMRELINVIDRPVDQVLIEGRIVIATDTFARDLGARFGSMGDRLWHLARGQERVEAPEQRRVGGLEPRVLALVLLP